MSVLESQRLSDAVTLHTFTDPRFKTMKVSVNLFLPLEQATAARNAILPSLASRATRAYPDYTALNGRLAQLYGASLSNSVRKMGDFQVLSLSANGISSRYAFGGEDMFAQLTGLLFDVLFDPLKDQEGLFPEDGFRQEQRCKDSRRTKARHDRAHSTAFRFYALPQASDIFRITILRLPDDRKLRRACRGKSARELRIHRIYKQRLLPLPQIWRFTINTKLLYTASFDPEHFADFLKKPLPLLLALLRRGRRERNLSDS